jgi:hypothetical protein
VEVHWRSIRCSGLATKAAPGIDQPRYFVSPMASNVLVQ